MKTILFTLTLLITSSLCFGQNYQPFSETSSKRFFVAGDPTDNDYFFHSTASTASGDTTIVNQYYSMQNDGSAGSTFPECAFWGGTSGDVLDTTWLGNHLKWNALTQELILENESNELLTFDFGTGIGSSSQFYTDGTTNYFIEHTATILDNFFGISDSVQIYTVNAFDTGGNPVSSTLNNFEIQLSKNHGLLSFINCYAFPFVQEGLEIQGQTNPLIGNYQLTYDEAYPWQVGDVLQYYSYNSIQQGITKIAYRTLTVTDRTETADSVFITYDTFIQETNASIPSSFIYGINSDPIRYKKGDPIWEKPWNYGMQQQNVTLIQATEETMTECTTLNQFITSESFNTYCDSCHCYGSYDGFGSSVHTHYYTENLGIYRYASTPYGPTIGFHGAELIYWNINGVECGTLWNNIDEIPQFDLSASPNPTKDKLQIASDQIHDEIRVVDLMGRLILKLENISQKTTEISLASFQKGAYILEVTANGSTQTQTIIKE